MHQWTASALVQIMACCPFSVKPLPEPVLTTVNSPLWNGLQWKSYQITIIFINEHAFENIFYNLSASLLRSQFINCINVFISLVSTTYSFQGQPHSTWPHKYTGNLWPGSRVNWFDIDQGILLEQKHPIYQYWLVQGPIGMRWRWLFAFWLFLKQNKTYLRLAIISQDGTGGWKSSW